MNYQYLTWVQQALSIEAQSIAEISQNLGDDFVQAALAILNCTGRTIVMGMGKSGHIGRKIAATLASTGTPAFFVHPADYARRLCIEPPSRQFRAQAAFNGTRCHASRRCTASRVATHTIARCHFDHERKRLGHGRHY